MQIKSPCGHISSLKKCATTHILYKNLKLGARSDRDSSSRKDYPHTRELYAGADNLFWTTHFQSSLQVYTPEEGALTQRNVTSGKRRAAYLGNVLYDTLF